MELEKQVVSLELAKKLEELGVKQESLFYWRRHKVKGMVIEYGRNDLDEYLTAAFTVAELGEMLPDRTRTDKRDGSSWVSCEELVKPEIADTEADARAKMLIYLIENGLIKI